MNNNNIDISKLLQALSKMDKNELQAGMAKASKILKENDKNTIIDQLNKNNK